eukprot:Pgem_evm1s5695
MGCNVSTNNGVVLLSGHANTDNNYGVNLDESLSFTCPNNEQLLFNGNIVNDNVYEFTCDVKVEYDEEIDFYLNLRCVSEEGKRRRRHSGS